MIGQGLGGRRLRLAACRRMWRGSRHPRRRSVGLVTVGWLAIASIGSLATAASAAQITEIAPTSSVTNPVPVALNDSGVVTGGAALPFRWSGGVFTTLSTLPSGGHADAFDINAGGEVVGDAQDSGGQLTPAVRWPAGSTTPTALQCLGGPCTSGAVAYGINDAGEIAGASVVETLPSNPACGALSYCTVPVTWSSSGAVTQIGNKQGVAYDVNASGTVVWQEFLPNSPALTHVTASGGTDTTLPCLRTGAANGGFQINAAGTVVGTEPGPPQLPAYAKNGTCTTLPLVPGSLTSLSGSAEAINDQGVIVGRSGPPGNGVAVEWSPDGSTVTDLNTLLPANSGWTLEEALDINSRGQILGIGSLNGNETYFVLDSASDLTASVTLTGSDGQPFTGGASGVGKTLVATVTLSEAATASAPITGITVDPSGLTISPPSAVTYVSGPTPVPPTSLTPRPEQAVRPDVQGCEDRQGDAVGDRQRARGNEAAAGDRVGDRAPGAAPDDWADVPAGRQRPHRQPPGRQHDQARRRRTRGKCPRPSRWM